MTIKPGKYTPRLGHELFQHITSMARPQMDSVNTAIRCPYSTLPRNGRVPKKSVKRKEIYRFYIFTKGLIILRKMRSEDAIDTDKV
jgi:hypothetical protein